MASSLDDSTPTASTAAAQLDLGAVSSPPSAEASPVPSTAALDALMTPVVDTAAVSVGAGAGATPSPAVEAGAGAGAVTATPTIGATGAAAATATPVKRKKKPKKGRCAQCSRKVGMLGFECRCKLTFCDKHRDSSDHDCSFDYAADTRRILKKQNPKVEAVKVERI